MTVQRLVVCFVILGFLSPPDVSSQDLDVDRFKAECLSSWQKLKALRDDISVTMLTDTPDNSLVEFHSRGPHVLAAEKDDPSRLNANPRRGIFASNPDYHFWIQEAKDGTWQLRVLEMSSEPDLQTPIELRSRYFLATYAWDHPGLNCCLADTFEHPKCVWKNIRRVEYQGRKCLEATLEEVYVGRSTNKELWCETVAVFDSENQYAMLRGERLFIDAPRNYPARSVRTVTYGTKVYRDVKMPVQITDDRFDRIDSEPDSDTTRFVDFSGCVLTDREFYFSTYGLPEPAGVTPPKQPGSRRLIAAGLSTTFILLIGVVLRRRRRRTAHMTTFAP